MEIRKQDLFQMDRKQKLAGQYAWKRAGREGRLSRSGSFDAESTAPKAWIQYRDGKGMELSVVECEVYRVGRYSDEREGVAMLHGMCPKCGETFLAREDNKTLSLDRITYRQAPQWLRVHWEHQCRHVLARLPRDDDPLMIVSSSERWACDYCKGWCVRVHGGVAVDDHRGATQLVVAPNTPIIQSKSIETVEV